MWFGVLGPVEVRDGGRAVAVGGPRVRALLAMLLLDAGNLVGTERLIDGLYGEDPPAGVGNALQSQVSRLRRVLGDAALVEGHPAGYRLNVPREDVDVHRFGRLVREGRGREALELWRGPALADVRAPFAAGQAVRLEELRDTVAEDCAEAEITAGRYTRPIDELRGLLAARPLRERARGLLMRALYGSGRQAEALEVYERGRRLLAEELGADPSPELAEIHLAILRGDAGAPERRRLPVPLTSFVGRDEELARVRKMLAEGRLVTLLGPGGAGKTRLALEAAERSDGDVFFVDLSQVGEAAEVPGAVLGALGLRESAMAPGAHQAVPEDRLVMALEGRRTLLVLDNCEHVVEAAARLAHRLLAALPGLRVLATGREALGVTGEALRPLPPLESPPEGTGAAEAAGYPAVRLFADRAAAVWPGFAVTAANVAAVVRICAALDGLPLAIELAAARLRSLPVEEVARRLDDRFRLLSRGDRAAPLRHRTLRGVVEWSWEPLGDEERTLARRFSVFAGGATLEAAEHVCGMGGGVDDLLSGLVEKSLLQADGMRYRMLGTVRAFCAERLEEAGEAERITAAHTAYFLDLARRADPHLHGHGQLEWLDRLADEHAELHAALRRCIRTDQVTALRLVGALTWYWWLRGRIEAGPLSVALLDAVGLEPPEGCDEEYVLCVTNALSAGARGARASAALDLATEKMAALRRQLEHPSVIVLWALTAGPERSVAEAVDAQAGRDPWSRALLDMSDGFMAQFRGDLAEAERCAERALGGFRALGDRWGMANSLDPLAQLADRRGDRDRAMVLLSEALGMVGELGASEEAADLLCRRAGVHVHAGDLDAASADFEKAAELARRAGAGDKAASASYGLGEVARLRGDTAEARRRYEEVLSGAYPERFIASAIRAGAYVGLGWIALAQRDGQEARARVRRALEMTLDHPVFTNRPQALVALADVALLEGDGERAAFLAGAATAVRGDLVPGDPDLARVEAGARRLVGDAAYETAQARGAALPADQALTEALAT